MGTDLYRFYDTDGVLLYVGISLSAIQRASQHKSDKGWWSHVARMEVQHVEGKRSVAEHAERDAIQAEHPLHNIIHNETPSVSVGVTWRCEICGFAISNGEGYIELKNRRHWRAIHRSCDPDINSSGYWFDVGRARTEDQMYDWTDHLRRKRWFGETDWYELLERIGA